MYNVPYIYICISVYVYVDIATKKCKFPVQQLWVLIFPRLFWDRGGSAFLHTASARQGNQRERRATWTTWNSGVAHLGLEWLRATIYIQWMTTSRA
jgi:hypothetical protein